MRRHKLRYLRPEKPSLAETILVPFMVGIGIIGAFAGLLCFICGVVWIVKTVAHLTGVQI